MPSTARLDEDQAPPLGTQSLGWERDASTPDAGVRGMLGCGDPPDSPMGWSWGFVSLGFAPQPLGKARACP